MLPLVTHLKIDILCFKKKLLCGGHGLCFLTRFSVLIVFKTELQSAKIILVQNSDEIKMYIICDCNIRLFYFALYTFLVLPTLHQQKLSLLIALLYFFMYRLFTSVRSFFTLLLLIQLPLFQRLQQDIAKTKEIFIANAFKSDIYRYRYNWKSDKYIENNQEKKERNYTKN